MRSYRTPFRKADDLFVLRTFNLNGRQFVAGDPFDYRYAGFRRARQMYDVRLIGHDQPKVKTKSPVLDDVQVQEETVATVDDVQVQEETVIDTAVVGEIDPVRENQDRASLEAEFLRLTGKPADQRWKTETLLNKIAVSNGKSA